MGISSPLVEDNFGSNGTGTIHAAGSGGIAIRFEVAQELDLGVLPTCRCVFVNFLHSTMKICRSCMSFEDLGFPKARISKTIASG